MQNEGTEVARKLLQHSFSDHEMTQLVGRTRLDSLDDVSAERIAALILDESPETQALILAHIDARKSFETFEELPIRFRSQLLFRISKLNPISTIELDELNKILKEKIKTHSPLSRG